MATLCLDTSIETLWPLCCRCKLHLQGDLCRCLHKGSTQALQAVVTLSAPHALRNGPQFVVQGFEVCTAREPILGADEGQKVPLQHSWVVLAFWAGSESCWKTHSWPMKRVMLRCFTTPCSMSSWHTRTPVSPLSSKMKMCHPLMGHLPSNHYAGRVMASLHPWNIFLHLTGCLRLNLVVLVFVLLLDGEDFLVCEEMFLWPFSTCHWRRCSALVHWIAFKAGVRMCPFEGRWTLMCWSSLMMCDIDWVDMFSSQDMIFCFQGGFRRIRSRTVLIVASALKLFRCPDWALSSKPRSSL